MADPRSDMAALRGLGVAPPGRGPSNPTPSGDQAPPAATPSKSEAATKPAKKAPGRRAPAKRPTTSTGAARAPQPPPREGGTEPVADDRRSRHTTVYLEAAARAALEERLSADRDATVADVMLGAVRAAVPQLREERRPPPGLVDDALPPPPRRRRRRRVEDGRAVPVRFSSAEREALDRLGEELDRSVSGLVSAALTLGPKAPSPPARRQRSTAKR